MSRMLSSRRGKLRLGSVLAAAAAAVGLLVAFTPTTGATVREHHADHHTGGTCTTPGAPTITSAPAGTVSTQPVNLYTLSNCNGMVVKIFNYGGIIQSIAFPDANGNVADVTLGYPTLQDYVQFNAAANVNDPKGLGTYFGALIGRYANRIANGQFTLKGVTYNVPINNGPNALHGGFVGFDQQVWTPTVLSGGSDWVGLQLEYVSPNGSQGFPGNLDTIATYTLNNQNQLKLTFHATTDMPTVLNLTNHTYWNLAGEASGPVYNQTLYINSNQYSPVDANQIPLGPSASVTGTPFDFSTAKPIGQDIYDNNAQLQIGHGFDNNWVLNQTNPPSLIEAAQAVDPSSGRTLTVWTTQPGLQFYSGNYLVGQGVCGTSGHCYRQSDGFALETQHFPDSPNQPSYPTTELDPGQVYSQTTVFQLSNS
ncbi:MAG TPA: aldose epimerase family protein [Acidimicrobiales bacterium]|nr:aldose epimerase family protein [Acidimicrobiales bacterium]